MCVWLHSISISVPLRLSPCYTSLSLHRAHWLLCNAPVRRTRRHDSDDTWQTCPGIHGTVDCSLAYMQLTCLFPPTCSILMTHMRVSRAASLLLLLLVFASWLQANLITAPNLVSFWYQREPMLQWHQIRWWPWWENICPVCLCHLRGGRLHLDSSLAGRRCRKMRGNICKGRLLLIFQINLDSWLF